MKRLLDTQNLPEDSIEYQTDKAIKNIQSIFKTKIDSEVPDQQVLGTCLLALGSIRSDKYTLEPFITLQANHDADLKATIAYLMAREEVFREIIIKVVAVYLHAELGFHLENAILEFKENAEENN